MASGASLTSALLSSWACPGCTQWDFTLPPGLSFSYLSNEGGGWACWPTVARAPQVPVPRWHQGHL